MLQRDLIKGVLLDYGGTIDTDGVHWAEVLWTFYQRAGVPVSREAFDAAYVHGERTLGRKPIVQPSHNFHDLLSIKVQIQMEELFRMGLLKLSDPIARYTDSVATASYDFARRCVAGAKPTLERLSRRYPLALVSNFYGNIGTVLDDFGVASCFGHIVESAVVGVRKPDPAIFTLGARALGFDAARTVVVGDSYSKDIEPAKLAGCQTVWLNVQGWECDASASTAHADEVIAGFSTLNELLAL